MAKGTHGLFGIVGGRDSGWLVSAATASECTLQVGYQRGPILPRYHACPMAILEIIRLTRLID